MYLHSRRINWGKHVDQEWFWNRIVTPRIGIGSDHEVPKDCHACYLLVISHNMKKNQLICIGQNFTHHPSIIFKLTFNFEWNTNILLLHISLCLTKGILGLLHYNALKSSLGKQLPRFWSITLYLWPLPDRWAQHYLVISYVNLLLAST